MKHWKVEYWLITPHGKAKWASYWQSCRPIPREKMEQWWQKVGSSYTVSEEDYKVTEIPCSEVGRDHITIFIPIEGD